MSTKHVEHQVQNKDIVVVMGSQVDPSLCMFLLLNLLSICIWIGYQFAWTCEKLVFWD